jgi:hypothetical protein
MFLLWRDVIREATFSRKTHKESTAVVYALASPYFVFSEVYVFFWFFLGFLPLLAYRLQLKLGGIWPPYNIVCPKSLREYLS